MKPIGPYVAVHELPTPPPGVAAAQSLIQTLRATDRLTGIPVLLHVLPYAESLPELPFSPHLLPVVDSGVDGELAYLVTELPLQAHPARDPLLTARGALAALAALHDDDLTHGGVSGAQLWNVDGGVALAGAGLPWREDATPESDLSDLAAALQEMGALPEALQPLRDSPGSLKAREALFLLGGATVAATDDQRLDRQAAEAQNLEAHRAASQTAEPTVPPMAESSASGSPVSGSTAELSEPEPLQPSPLHDGTPIVLGRPDTAEETMAEWDSIGLSGADEPQPAQTTVAGTASAPVPSALPSGQPETPQERRKRQNDKQRDQAMLDTRAAAARRAGRLNAQSLNAQNGEEAREVAKAAQQAALGVPVPEPFQMGFAEPVPEDAASRGAAASAAAARDLRQRNVERLPASLRRPQGGQPDNSVSRTPPAAAAQSAAEAQTSAGAAKRTLAPIRIGWDEDDTWRIVRTAPAARQGLPRWLWPLLALILLLGAAAIWAAARSKAAPVPAAVACCAVSFTLGGVAGVTAELSVESAPGGANLPATTPLGTIPGKITFPVAGLYRLRVAASAEGFRPGIVNVSVPSQKPVNINLGN